MKPAKGEGLSQAPQRKGVFHWALGLIGLGHLQEKTAVHPTIAQPATQHSAITGEDLHYADESLIPSRGYPTDPEVLRQTASTRAAEIRAVMSKKPNVGGRHG